MLTLKQTENFLQKKAILNTSIQLMYWYYVTMLHELTLQNVRFNLCMDKYAQAMWQAVTVARELSE